MRRVTDGNLFLLFFCCASLLRGSRGRPHPVTEMQCFVSTPVGFPMSVTCWPRLCGSSPPSERPVAALWTPWSPTGVMSIAIPLGVTTPDTSYSDMAAGSEWVLPHGGGGEGVGAAGSFAMWEKEGAGPLAVWEVNTETESECFNKCSFVEMGKFDTGNREKENSSRMRHSTMGFISAWLVSLHSSVGSVHLLRPCLTWARCKPGPFPKAVLREGLLCWASLSAEPAGSASVPVLHDWFLGPFGAWLCETASACVDTLMLFVPVSGFEEAHLSG